LSILVVILAIAATFYFSTEYFSALGSLFGAAAGTLAVIWFSASLYNQSQQLKEQRQQFLENFKQLREDNRRNSLIVVKDIMVRAEERALKSNPILKSIDDLMVQYINISEWPNILKSKDPNIVLEDGKKWILTKETPAFFLMRGIKSAAETYFRAIGKTDIDYSVEPELFVFTHGPTLWEIPYFEEYQGIATFLSEAMVRMTPGRKAVHLAYSVAALKKASDEDMSGIMNEDKIIEDIKQHEKAGYSLPAIAKDLANDLGQSSVSGGN
jgi:hypothetical protein